MGDDGDGISLCETALQVPMLILHSPRKDALTTPPQLVSVHKQECQCMCVCVMSRLTSSGFFCRHILTKSLNVSEKSPSNSGGGALGIMVMSRIGSIFARGGSPFAISIQVMPNDHISAYTRDMVIFRPW